MDVFSWLPALWVKWGDVIMSCCSLHFFFSFNFALNKLFCARLTTSLERLLIVVPDKEPLITRWAVKWKRVERIHARTLIMTRSNRELEFPFFPPLYFNSAASISRMCRCCPIKSSEIFDWVWATGGRHFKSSHSKRFIDQVAKSQMPP